MPASKSMCWLSKGEHKVLHLYLYNSWVPFYSFSVALAYESKFLGTNSVLIYKLSRTLSNSIPPSLQPLNFSQGWGAYQSLLRVGWTLISIE